MTLDNLTALAARDAWLYVAHAWPALQARLVPGDGAPGAGTGEPARLPIDVAVSDLMREIEDSARFYGLVLLEEVPPVHGCGGACHGSPEHSCGGHLCATDGEPVVAAQGCPSCQEPITTSAMPGLLREVASRYGHFTVSEDRIALDFADAAHEAQRKVHGALERPAPPRWVGPCPDEACEGSLRQRENQLDARCRTCGREVGALEWQALMYEAFEDRLMTRSEIVSALVVTQHEVKPNTVDKWVQRGKLVPVAEGSNLFRFADAYHLAEASASGRTAA